MHPGTVMIKHFHGVLISMVSKSIEKIFRGVTPTFNLMPYLKVVIATHLKIK